MNATAGPGGSTAGYGDYYGYGIFDAEADLKFTKGLDIPVLCTWLAEWLLAFGFSRFARWKARQGDGDKWALYALLPAYEGAIVFKKIALVAVLLLTGFEHNGFSTAAESAGSAVAFAVNWFAVQLYAFTYVTVLYVLSARSAGTITLHRAIGTTLLLALIVGSIQFFDAAGPKNQSIVKQNSAHNTSIPRWPSFGGDGYSSLTTSAPGIDQIVIGTKSSAAIAFWVAVAAALLGVIGTVLACTNLWRPRQMGLAAALLAIFAATNVLSYCSLYETVFNALGFNPYILCGVVEMPLKYYILLLDSRVRHIHTQPTPYLTSPNDMSCMPVLEFSQPHRRQLHMLCGHTGQ